MRDILLIKETPAFLFRFNYGDKTHDIWRLSNWEYRFIPTDNMQGYIVPSWKNEVRRLTDGVVNYR